MPRIEDVTRAACQQSAALRGTPRDAGYSHASAKSFCLIGGHRGTRPRRPWPRDLELEKSVGPRGSGAWSRRALFGPWLRGIGLRLISPGGPLSSKPAFDADAHPDPAGGPSAALKSPARVHPPLPSPILPGLMRRHGGAPIAPRPSIPPSLVVEMEFRAERFGNLTRATSLQRQSPIPGRGQEHPGRMSAPGGAPGPGPALDTVGLDVASSRCFVIDCP